MIEYNRRSGPEWISSTRAVDEVCRSILNPRSLAFVTANAPSRVADSFEARQQQLARFSLQVLSEILRQRIGRRRAKRKENLFRYLNVSIAKTRDALLLTACGFGRLGLATVSCLRHGIPRRAQLAVSSLILSKIGNLVMPLSIDGYRSLVQASGAETKYAYAVPSVSNVPTHKLAVVQDILRALEASLPNDVARLIFLATLRDNNSGRYYHPEVERRFSAGLADQAMLACHQQIYGRVVALSLEDLTDQVDEYLGTIRAPRQRLIESWTKLRAYRATIPMDSDPISAEIFFMKIDVAVAILESRLPTQVQ